ncbi:hypothetical protein ACFCP7_24860 [Paenibacillus elgii]
MPNLYMPRHFHTVTPYFTVSGADKLIEFMKAAFEAKLLNRSHREDGSVQHAEVMIGDTIVEVTDANDRFAARPSTVHLFVADTDDCYRRALEAGAASSARICRTENGARASKTRSVTTGTSPRLRPEKAKVTMTSDAAFT